ncbi:hypothetical protein V1524DRAFT_409804 [Lipomyces starkeyi]
MCGGQILIMFVGGQAFGVVRITAVQWAVSVIVGLLSIPIGLFLRLCVPDSVAYRIYKPFGTVGGFIGRELKRLWPTMFFRVIISMVTGKSKTNGTLSAKSSIEYDYATDEKTVKSSLTNSRELSNSTLTKTLSGEMEHVDSSIDANGFLTPKR